MSNIGELVNGFEFSDGSDVAVIGAIIPDDRHSAQSAFVIENMPTKIEYPTIDDFETYREIDAYSIETSGHFERQPLALFPILKMGEITLGAYISYDCDTNTWKGPTLATSRGTGETFEYYNIGAVNGLYHDPTEYAYSNYFIVTNTPSSLVDEYPYSVIYDIWEYYGENEYRREIPFENLYLGVREDSWLVSNGISVLRFIDGQGEAIPITEGDTTKTQNPSSSGGGDGSYNPNSDAVDVPGLPNLSAVGCGMVTLYNPSLVQLQSLGGYLWSDSTDFFENLSKMWTDPTDAIINLGIFPMSVPHGSYKNVKIGNMATGVSMPTVSGQYLTVDCGEVYVDEYFGGALDYNPYTRISIFLPFVGVQQLNTDDVMGAYLRVVYNIDLLTGAFAVVVKARRGNLNSVLYHYSGNMMTPIPITSNDFSGLYNSVVQLAGGVTQVLSGNAGAGAGSIASAVMGSKETIGRSGQISGNAGLMDNMTPYLIIERPIQSLADGYKKFEGYPSNVTSDLGGLTGFTMIESVISNSLACPENEQNEIIDLLKSGVYL